MPAGTRISLAVLARDAEDSIAQAIRSAQAVVDEVVVRDTGSRDGTADAARALGAAVVRGSWHDDFSEARNRLVASCTGDWVLVLDADERLSAGAEDLRALVDEPRAASFRVEIASPAAGGRIERTRAPRLFRRRPAARYRHRVHEILEGAEPALPSRLRLAHDGFVPPLREAKSRRNLALLERELDAAPADPYLLWKRSEELVLLERHADAAAAWDRLAEVLSALDATGLAHLDFAPEAARGWLEALTRDGHAPRALPLASRTVLAHPRRPLARLAHAAALAAAGRAEDARRAAHILAAHQAWTFASPEEPALVAAELPRLLQGEPEALADGSR